ncbi:hypothetical protein [Burkholderia pyrrocinia]|uniref:hypothetical protein n=1 Tax=Burkholderia pyrrocinia TaxID=60550 RepID=UPI0035C69B7B
MGAGAVHEAHDRYRLGQVRKVGPHEFATWLLVRQAPDQLDMNRAEFDALLERQPVSPGSLRAQRSVGGVTCKRTMSWSITAVRSGRW